MKDIFKENIATVLSFLGVFFGTLFGYFSGRGKNDAETDSITIGNFSMGYEAYQKLLTDLEERYEFRIKKYEKGLKDLNDQLEKCKNEMESIIKKFMLDVEQKKNEKSKNS
jgi:hypothetical protein